MTTKINNASPETIEAFGWQIQRGYVYKVVPCDEFAWDCSIEHETDEGQIVEDRRFGYHGNNIPPCGADYLFQGDGPDADLLVIASESDPADIDTVDGFSLELVRLDKGEHYHDGTWGFFVLSVASDGETIIAGRA
jgi:hypothetical protein